MTPKVSDHAVLRYIERVMGFDVEKIRRDMMPQRSADAIKNGAKKIRRDGFVYIVKDGVIVTVIKA